MPDPFAMKYVLKVETHQDVRDGICEHLERIQMGYRTDARIAKRKRVKEMYIKQADAVMAASKFIKEIVIEVKNAKP